MTLRHPVRCVVNIRRITHSLLINSRNWSIIDKTQSHTTLLTPSTYYTDMMYPYYSQTYAYSAHQLPAHRCTDPQPVQIYTQPHIHTHTLARIFMHAIPHAKKQRERERDRERERERERRSEEERARERVCVCERECVGKNEWVNKWAWVSVTARLSRKQEAQEEK